MTRDPLSEATRALREAHEAPADGARFTRSRVMASLRESELKRRTRLTFLIPLAACFVSLSAWGAASGELPRALRAAATALGFESAGGDEAEAPPPAPAPKQPAVSGRSPEANPAPPAEPPAEPEAAAPVDPLPVTAPAPPRAVHGAPATVPGAAPAPAASVTDPTHDLYRAAHRKHFVDQDPAGALGAWDEYLRAAPDGRFAVEARYNRALCLARLGRAAEARAALAPFARGDFKGYRQREAAELSSALGAE